MQTASPLNFWFFLTWSWVCGTIIVIGTFAMEWRRNIQPVKARDRFLSFLTNFGYLSAILLRSVITFRPDLSCLFDLWQAPISIGFLSSIYLLRSWWMYFKFELAHERSLLRSLDVKRQTSEDPGHHRSVSLTPSTITRPGNRITWFSDHRYLISDPFTMAFTSISVLIFFIPNVIQSFQETFINAEAGDSVKCKLSPFMSFWQSGWGLIYLAGLLIFAIKLRKTFDAFGIKQELKAVFWLNVFSWSITTVLAVGTSDKFNTTVFNFRKLAPMVFNILLFIQTTAIPVYRTFEIQGENAVVGTGATNDINTLTGLLKSPDGFSAFQQYLIGCFCVESCLFWKDIEEYRAQVLSSLRFATQQRVNYLSDLRLLLDRAREINLIYIKEDSRLQVNISSSQRQRVENAVNNLLVKYETQVEQNQAAEVTATPKELAVPAQDGIQRASLIGLLQPNSIRAGDSIRPGTPNHEKTGEKGTEEGNISSDLKEQFKDILNVFNIAQLEVIELMRTDPYPRFRLTKPFLELLQQSELKQHRIDALRDLNVI